MSDSTYRGTTPRPADFDAFWDARMAEADSSTAVLRRRTIRNSGLSDL